MLDNEFLLSLLHVSRRSTFILVRSPCRLLTQSSLVRFFVVTLVTVKMGGLQARSHDFFRAMRCISAAYTVMRCLCVCVCVSVMFVSCVKTNKDIFEIFSPSGSHIILVFPYQTGWRYSDGNRSNGGVECRCIGRNRDSEPICLLLTLQQARCCKHGRRWTTATISKVVTLISLVVHCGYSTTKRHAR